MSITHVPQEIDLSDTTEFKPGFGDRTLVSPEVPDVDFEDLLATVRTEISNDTAIKELLEA